MWFAHIPYEQATVKCRGIVTSATKKAEATGMPATTYHGKLGLWAATDAGIDRTAPARETASEGHATLRKPALSRRMTWRTPDRLNPAGMVR